MIAAIVIKFQQVVDEQLSATCLGKRSFHEPLMVTALAVSVVSCIASFVHGVAFCVRQTRMDIVPPMPLPPRRVASTDGIVVPAARPKISFSSESEVGIALFNLIGMGINIAILGVFLHSSSLGYVEVLRDDANSTATTASPLAANVSIDVVKTPSVISFGTASQIVLSSVAGAVTSFTHGFVAVNRLRRGDMPNSRAGATTLTLLETLPSSLGVGSAGIHAASLVLGLGNLVALRRPSSGNPHTAPFDIASVAGGCISAGPFF